MILDTNAVSAFAEGNSSVRERIAVEPGPYLPVIVIGEYRYGLLEARNRERRLAWLEALARHWHVLEISSETAEVYADIRQALKRQATPIPSNDVWIAALARQHGVTVLSADTHFDRIPGIKRQGW